ncbi:2-C-methyl-D-erythritol 2,4-cyclodiphosphate synthase [Salicibibacter cibi]|uniref:2-C-methyl-D-erythritol 2,4-cyclodiphosphate synthase n=1 Tax=Salicibibacter cibi TaxID=2743001 RepID=A0A7T6Z7V2_9BACI|nr:2-C-methyl-D-erythritol 2,4-cyclodiphosphate synthase [Salicibibacter cibi]QQK78571.1 2-C-methyl-D-erythritol 2,4-cyclodiphosphate synthase [Salicibibacter cibi]
MRIGQGFDVHAFAKDRPLIIGGLSIPYEYGLKGHSDADVLLHAIADACLGAIGEGDIGRHFPDTDPVHAGADSANILEEVFVLAENKGYTLVNLDATIIAQKPKMVSYILPMRERIAKLFRADLSQVNVKATTSERLGFAGREEGIAAMAVILLESK